MNRAHCSAYFKYLPTFWACGPWSSLFDDRFARSVSHLLKAFETFQAQGIEFVYFSEQLDTSTPAGKLIFTVLGTVAELKRSLIVSWTPKRASEKENLGRPLLSGPAKDHHAARRGALPGRRLLSG
jgi:DNA invertase Pin-like site-specific DNA recombinase